MDIHGGNIHRFARERRVSGSRILDFSASINPLGPSPAAYAAVARSTTQITHYPDPDACNLRQALAAHWRFDETHFLAGNGSTELIYLLPAALALSRPLIVGPTFSEYERSFTVAGGSCAWVMARRDDGFRVHVTDVLQAIRMPDVDCCVLANPNSPTGQLLSQEDILAIGQACTRRAIPLIVDETFAEYCPKQSILDAVQQYPNLVVLRSFTKFYALPGLRVGYLAADIKMVAAIRRHQPPWTVNSMGAAAARAALHDRRHAARSLKFMDAERAWFETTLRSIPGLTVFPSAVNFVLLELPRAWTASRMVRALAPSQILVRDCSTMRGCGDRLIRVAIRRRDENRTLVRRLHALLTAK